MSDLLAPLFAVMNDEVTAFWAFVGFMDRMVCSPHFINAGFFLPCCLTFTYSF